MKHALYVMAEFAALAGLFAATYASLWLPYLMGV